MTYKAYIVVNEKQEREVLDKLEQEGLVWCDGDKLTKWIPSQNGFFDDFPYALNVTNDKVFITTSWLTYELDFDGRKEEKMSDKYVVSQEFMNSLNEWRENLSDFSMSENFVGPTAIDELDDIVDGWWNITDLSGEEQNSRLIAILSWVNGEDVFEVEKPKKWVVRSKERDEYGNYAYILLENMVLAFNRYHINEATRFDTKEEAESWANSHQEVIEVEAE